MDRIRIKTRRIGTDEGPNWKAKWKIPANRRWRRSPTYGSKAEAVRVARLNAERALGHIPRDVGWIEETP